MASPTITFFTVMASAILLLGLAVAAPTRTSSPHNRQTRAASVELHSTEWNLTAAYSVANNYMNKNYSGFGRATDEICSMVVYLKLFQRIAVDDTESTTITLLNATAMEGCNWIKNMAEKPKYSVDFEFDSTPEQGCSSNDFKNFSNYCIKIVLRKQVDQALTQIGNRYSADQLNKKCIWLASNVEEEDHFENIKSSLPSSFQNHCSPL